MAKNDLFFSIEKCVNDNQQDNGKVFPGMHPLKNVSNDNQQDNGKVFPGMHDKSFAILA